MPANRAEPFVDAAGIVAMLRLPSEAHLVDLWSNEDYRFPTPVRTEGGMLWSRNEVRQWSRLWGWRGKSRAR